MRYYTLSFCFGCCLIGMVGVQSPALAEVQTGDTPTPPAELLQKAAPDKADYEQSQDPDLPALEAGNLFHSKGGKLSYWDGLVGHAMIEGGANGNPVTHSGRNFGQYFTDKSNTGTLNQITASISHPVTPIGKGYGIGFVVEMLYGSDARVDPTLGMGDGTLKGGYQWAPTQAHIDVHTPWLFKHGIDFQIGQMYGLMGVEGIPALARPFYSYNYSSDYIVPFETVGIVATMHVSRDIDFLLGIDSGNASTFGNATVNKQPKGYAGLVFKNLMDNKMTIRAISHLGPAGNSGTAVTSADGWTSAGIGSAANKLMQYNVEVSMSYRFTDKVTFTEDIIVDRDESIRDTAYGFTSYVAWDLRKNLTLNFRGEIFRDNTGGVITQFIGSDSYRSYLRNRLYAYYSAPATTYGELTAGVSWKPPVINDHLGKGTFTLRPELRLDRSLNGTHPFNRSASVMNPVVTNGTRNMFWVSCDAILSF
ncbi:outer membrane beta-barrel protein [Zymomonas mobilis]|uniref:outer membrane beta-barrel protein n=1 Tax=Zymomonas mobilis TaxID=542 RepID=UPI0007840F99|nr:outer membrane beta-barrel protein [Zymomonas mobilis]